MSALATVERGPTLSRPDQVLFWNIRKFISCVEVLLPEERTALFGAIYAAKTEHPVLRRAREEVLLRFPDLTAYAGRLLPRTEHYAGLREVRSGLSKSKGRRRKAIAA